MNLKEITIDGKVYDLVPREEATPQTQKTGYERAERGGKYFLEWHCREKTDSDVDEYGTYGNMAFKNALYYTNEKLANDNIRADRLLRRLRRFSAVNRKNKIDWKNSNQMKFHIIFDYKEEEINVVGRSVIRHFGGIYFDTKELAAKAIEEFRDDLMWYFTKYKDIAEEPAEDDD